MALISEPRIDNVRFASYVEELQQFSVSHDIAYGAPKDLLGLLAALNGNQIFFDEWTSILRSVVYRERGQALPDQLLELVASAWGGPHIADSAPSLHEQMRSLLKCVSGVMRTPQQALPPVLDTVTLPGSLAPGLAETFEDLSEMPTVQADVLSMDNQPETGLFRDEKLTHNDALSSSELDEAICLLEICSPDVRHYIQLLQERAQNTASATQMATRHSPTPMEVLTTTEPSAAAPPSLYLNDEVLQQNSVVLDQSSIDPQTLPADQPLESPEQNAVPAISPWDENSELQQELRRFAKYKAREEAFQAALAARPLHIKVRDSVASAFGRAPRYDLLPTDDDEQV